MVFVEKQHALHTTRKRRPLASEGVYWAQDNVHVRRDKVRGTRLRKGMLHAELYGSERGPMLTVWPRMGTQDFN